MERQATMDDQQTAEKVAQLYELANELTDSAIPVVRQRAAAIVGLLQELMVTVVGRD